MTVVMVGELVTVTRACVACNEVFELEPGEQRFYAEREWPLPKRCAPCRRAKKLIVEGRGTAGRCPTPE